MARRPANKRRGNSVSIAWNEAEISNMVTRPGVYTFEVTKAEEGDAGQIVVDSKVTSEGRQEGKTLRTWFGTKPTQLWVLARFLEAVGEEIPDDEADLDLDGLVGKEYIAEVEEQEYNGDKKLRIAARTYGPVDEAEEEEEVKPKGKKKVVEEEDEEEEEAPKRGRGRPAGSKNKPKDEDEEDEDEGEDEKPRSRRGKSDDDEESSSGKRGSKRSGRGSGDDDEKSSGKSTSKKGGKLPKVSEDEIQDMTEEDLEEIIEKYGLDVDLDEQKTLRKKAAMVIDALGEADYLE